VKTLFCVLSAAASLAQAAEKVTYNDQVLPILKNACLNCHNPDKKKAGLDLSTYQATLQGSENGKILEPGNAATSLLFKCVKQTEEPKMPPKGDRLTDDEIAVIERWIQGQLLETADGKAVVAAKNNVQTVVVSLEKPAGPPPMPGDLPLEPYLQVPRRNALLALAASPWAPLVAVGGEKQIALYHTDSLEPLGVLPFPEGFPAVLRFSRNGRLLLAGGGLGGKSGKVALWDIQTGERVASLGNEFDQVLGADLSPDQQFVALGGPAKVVKIYSTKDGKLVHSMKKHTDWVTAVAYSPDGKLLATGDRNGGIQLWEGDTGKEYSALPGHKVMVSGLAFMPGVVASASEDGSVKLWDVKEGKEIRSWTAHPGGAAWVDFTPDGRLVSCGRDKLCKVWDQTGKMLGQTEPFSDIALRAVVSNDRVIAGDWSGLIKVFALDGKPLGELSANPPPLNERFANAQTRLAQCEAAVVELQEKLQRAEENLRAEQSALEEKSRVLEAAKLLPGTVELRVTAEMKALEELKKNQEAATEPERAGFQEKINAQAAVIERSRLELAAATQAREAQLAAAAQSVRESLQGGIGGLENAVATAKSALERAQADAASAGVQLEKWRRARAYMAVYQSRQSVDQKQARYEALRGTVEAALGSADKTTRELEELSEAVSAAPARLAAKDAERTTALQQLEKWTAVVAAEQTAIKEKEAQLQALNGAEQKPAGTDNDGAGGSAAAEPLKADIAKLKENLERTRAEEKKATTAVAAAEKAAVELREETEKNAVRQAKLRQELPGLLKAAQAAKLQSEKELALAKKEWETARSAAERLRAEYAARYMVRGEG
jgi:WD40 repeat protein/mono/diheme cytochrome c family protein